MNKVRKNTAFSKPAVPLCPHCQTNTMHLDRSQTRWQCADGAACGFTLPVISEPRPIKAVA